MLQVRKASLRDALRLAPRLREADIREAEASTGEGAVTALIRSLSISEEAYAVISPTGDVMGLGGVARVNSLVGIPWFMASTDLEQHKITFLRMSRPWIESLQERYPVLWNYADKRNTLHLKWLQWCGFEFLNEIAYGAQGLPFVEFMRARNV